ncbi:hypothetical protein THTE_4216 [Thermogutta terrifontis]|uniref:Uncharacterized protein n=1 Tax=Thermogutta terrifontis TaxID=1331910 RepID=A0A286RLN9_9BACT|nr:hypothetical protein THTE_4216 [Thermogutta terrifontis]
MSRISPDPIKRGVFDTPARRCVITSTDVTRKVPDSPSKDQAISLI